MTFNIPPRWGQRSVSVEDLVWRGAPDERDGDDPLVHQKLRLRPNVHAIDGDGCHPPRLRLLREVCKFFRESLSQFSEFVRT